MDADKRGFPQTMGALRRAKGLSQRQAAAALGISQALLSHYENGAREPGLAFVCRACKYYGVSSDYILGLSDDPTGLSAPAAALRALTAELGELTEKAQNTLKELEK